MRYAVNTVLQMFSIQAIKGAHLHTIIHKNQN